MIIYQIRKNNIKVEINTTTINNLKPIVSLNNSKLMQKTKKKKNHLNNLQENIMNNEPNGKMAQYQPWMRIPLQANI